MRSLLSLIAGGGIGFWAGGPLGALAGVGVGYVVNKWYGGSSEPSVGSGVRASGPWAVSLAQNPPGDFKWFDQLAQKSKPSITFRAVLTGTDEFITVKGNVESVGVTEPQTGKRFWLVRQTSDFGSLDPTGADKLPPKGTVWTIFDNEIVSGDNSADTLKDAAGG
jgi:hypothetical protein